MLWILNEGLFYEKKYKFDLNGYTMVFFATLLLSWDVHEIRILFHFLRIELGRKLEFDESNRSLMVTTNETTERFRISDLREVIFCGPRISSRTSTAHLSYTQLNFKSGESFIVTSFVLNTQKMEQLLGGGRFKRTHFDRKLFEGITRR